jgi:hypothetical protein
MVSIYRQPMRTKPNVTVSATVQSRSAGIAGSTRWLLAARCDLDVTWQKVRVARSIFVLTTEYRVITSQVHVHSCSGRPVVLDRDECVLGVPHVSSSLVLLNRPCASAF